jgi:hypothetical protein
MVGEYLLISSLVMAGASGLMGVLGTVLVQGIRDLHKHPEKYLQAKQS